MTEYQQIDINDLELDLRNYRLNPQSDQRSAIKEMIAMQGSKLTKLAKDIIEIGVSPFDLTLVCRSEENPKLYTVLEGNRRVAALKCVYEPDLAEGTVLHRQFVQLSKASDRAPYELFCAVVKNKDDAFEFIRRKHDTGLEGAGTETWTAVMKERAAADQGRGNSHAQRSGVCSEECKLGRSGSRTGKEPNLSDHEPKEISGVNFTH